MRCLSQTHADGNPKMLCPPALPAPRCRCRVDKAKRVHRFITKRSVSTVITNFLCKTGLKPVLQIAWDNMADTLRFVRPTGYGL